MKDAPAQPDTRENAASSRRHASRLVERKSERPQAASEEAEDHSESTAFLGNRNGTTVGRDNEKLLTIQQVADLLHVPVSWVYGRTRKRSIERLPGIRLGKYWRFREEEIHAWVESQRGGHRAA
ncbi:MAG TPA: helix-turn-helix domain-containing protein [Verrucomicrobiae bacterium]|jgi:excisionase family DNA binding protein|nr:helix-turn-helix domain-containing protein [Verrucomicrobiae bacterium]